MRVIAGSRRSLKLVTVEGMDVRPTTDRTKETLFNILNPYIADCEFLDLFSGSGAIGIEALSRGAKRAVMVEQSKQALACIDKNLTVTRFKEQAEVMAQDVFMALKALETKGKAFDIIFMDPPYNNELERRVLERLSGSPLVGSDTWIIAEASNETDFSYLPSLNFELDREKIYKNNKHVFISPVK